MLSNEELGRLNGRRIRMLRRLVTASFAVATLLAIVQPASAQRFIYRRPLIVRPYYGYGYWYGPGWGYGPGWYYPYGPAYAFPPRPATGELKILTKVKGDSIYVDGGFAGVTGKLKHFDLSPGAHDIEIRTSSGRSIFQQRVQVIMGRTIEVRPPA
jgi:hypothetical protein